MRQNDGMFPWNGTVRCASWWASLVCGLTLAACVDGCSSEETHPQLVAKQVSPSDVANEAITAKPGERIQYLYQITNSSRKTVNEIRASLNCQCQIAEKLPEQLAPNESARFGFWVSAPKFGIVTQQVALFAEGSSVPVLVLQPTVTVETNAPGLLQDWNGAQMRFVAGENAKRVLSIGTVEHAQSDPWLTELKVNPAELLTVDRVEMKEFPEQDRTIVRRVYSFLCSSEMAVGNHFGSVQVTTTTPSRELNDAMPFELRVLEPVSFFPNPVRINVSSNPEQQGRVLVVRRISQVSVEFGDFDAQLLEVVPTRVENGELVEFQIKPRGASFENGHATLRMRVGNGDDAELRIELLSTKASG